MRERPIGPRKDVLREQDISTTAYLLLEGHTCRHRLLADGRRQITAIAVPGDICNPEAVTRGRTTYGLQALTSCVLGEIAIDHLREAGAGGPSAARSPLAADGARSSYLARVARQPRSAHRPGNELPTCFANYGTGSTRSALFKTTVTFSVPLRRGTRDRRLRFSARRDGGQSGGRPARRCPAQAAASRLSVSAWIGCQFHGSSSPRRWAGWDAMRPSTSASQA